MINSNYSEKMGQLKINDLAEKKDTETLISIVEISKDKNDIKYAIQALGGLKESKAVDPLIYALLSEFISIRHESIRALGKIGDEKAVKPLLILLNNNLDEKGDLREDILKSLGKIGNSKAIVGIISTLDSDLSEVASSVLKEVGEKAVEPLISTLKNIDNPGVREKAVEILGKIGDKKATQLLLSILNEPGGWELKEEVTKALGKMKDVSSVEALIKMTKPYPFHRDEDYRFQCILIEAFGLIGDKKATTLLMNLLRNKNSESRVRGLAASALGMIRDETAIDLFTNILENKNEKDGWVKNNVVWALLQYDENIVSIPLVKYFKQDKDFMAKYKPAMLNE